MWWYWLGAKKLQKLLGLDEALVLTEESVLSDSGSLDIFVDREVELDPVLAGW